VLDLVCRVSREPGTAARRRRENAMTDERSSRGERDDDLPRTHARGARRRRGDYVDDVAVGERRSHAVATHGEPGGVAARERPAHELERAVRRGVRGSVQGGGGGGSSLPIWSFGSIRPSSRSSTPG
jgi:hypothetical protein